MCSARDPDPVGVPLNLDERGIHPVETTDIPEHASLVGASRTPSEAGRYVELFLSMVLDKRADVTGMQIEVTLKSAEIWAFPFLQKDDTVEDLLAGTSVPVFALDDLKDILARWQEPTPDSSD